MSFKFSINPTTRKRIQRFCAIKRAYYSFWILLTCYLLSLFANIICNDKPLLMKFNDKYYYPIISNYYKEEFDPLENNTPADYKHLKTLPVFMNNKSNFMLFPPIPFGQEENIPLSELTIARDITLSIELEPKVGSIDINEDFTIRKAESPEFFFNENQEFKKLPLTNFVEINTELKLAIENRFSNIQSSELNLTTEFNKKKVTIKLIAYEPSENKPSKLRLQLFNIEISKDATNYAQNCLYKENAEPINEIPKIWSVINDDQKNEIHQKILKRAITFVDPIYLTIGEDVAKKTWKISFERKEAFYPYPPTKRNPLGFDESGRDVLTQIIYGFRLALSFGFLLVTLSILIGIFAGATQGYFGGKVDLLGQRFLEIWAALPFLYIVILLGNIFGPSFWLLLIIFVIFEWIGISHYIRADFLKQRKASYVEAAKCLGISNFQIMWRHILPNALVPIITFFPFMLVGAIGALTMLDFLGFGLPPGTPSWGALLSQAQTHHNAWWLILFPSLPLFFVMLLGTLIGDGLRAAFDPRKFHKIE
jgi:microcin C transport system permease protein